MKIENNLFNLDHGAYIVTGGLGFLGKAHCHAIAAFGGTPVIIDVNIEEGELIKSEIKEKYNIEIELFEGDITSKISLERICKKINNNYKICGLVNNAARNPLVTKNGLENSSRLEIFKLEDWEKDIKVGLTGSFLCTQVFGTNMSKNDGGSIVNISSDLGIISPKQSLYEIKGLSKNNQPVKPITYSVVKSGLIGLTKYTSTYWPKKVRANCICPGGILNNQSEDFLQKVNCEIPLGRLANLDEYSGILIYLLSNASSYMNGSVISVDGGRTAW